MASKESFRKLRELEAVLEPEEIYILPGPIGELEIYWAPTPETYFGQP